MARRKSPLLSAMLIAGLVGGTTLMVVPAAHGAPKGSRSAVADIELQLATLNAKIQKADDEAWQAQLKFEEAEANMNDAIGRVSSTQDTAVKLQQQVKEAQEKLGKIGSALYRQGATSISSFTAFFSASSFSEYSQLRSAHELLGQHASSEVEKYSALLAVANLMKKRASQAVNAEQKFANDAAAALAQANQKQREATELRDSLQSRKTSLITNLAASRGVSVESEEQRQNALAQQSAAAIAAQRAAQQAQLKRKLATESALKAAKAEAEKRNAELAAKKAAEQAAAKANKPGKQANPPAKSTAPSKPAKGAPASGPAPTPVGQETAPAPVLDPSQVTYPAGVDPARMAKIPNYIPRGLNGAPLNTPLGDLEARWLQAAHQPKQRGLSGSALGDALVQYARNFYGVPYIWGGNDTYGWDCSGFVHFLYGHFGVNVPRRSGYHVEDFWSAYRVVPKSERRPGDVLWWPGHVGIYTGGEKHIAAMNPSAGTQEHYIWGDPKYIRISE